MITSADNSLKTSWPRCEKNGSITGAYTGNNPFILLNTTVLWHKNHQLIPLQIENSLHLAILKIKTVSFI